MSCRVPKGEKLRNNEASKGTAATLVGENHKKLGWIPTLLLWSSKNQSKSFNLDQYSPISYQFKNYLDILHPFSSH